MAVAKLREFKQWLGSLGTRPSFTSPDDLKTKVLAALYDWRDRHPEFQAAPAARKHDPMKYLQWLRENTAWIDTYAVPSLRSRSPSFRLALSSHPSPCGTHHRLLKNAGRDTPQGGIKPPHSMARLRRAGRVLPFQNRETLRHRSMPQPN